VTDHHAGLAAWPEVHINLQAIRANVERLRASAPRAELMAVVKADGYGHGLVESGRAAVAGGATWLGVTTIEEALALRSAGVSARVLAWLVAPGGPWQAAIEADVDLSANARWAVKEIAAAAEDAARPARLHLKVDSGLGRGGAALADWPSLVDAALAAEAAGLVRTVGLWSHFAYADSPGHPTTARQVSVFREAADLAERAGLRPEVRHLANSAATLTLPESHLDLVRPGIAVYGISPMPATASADQLGLVPAMTLRAPVSHVKRVPAGHGVSYGHRYTTPRETTLAVVPLGYADGVPRHASGSGPVWLGGARRVVAGAVCMDQFVVDVNDDPVQPGDEAVLFGPGTDGEPLAEDWARAAGTIAYEIVARVGGRAVRTFGPLSTGAT
jgi:alanine racemase